MYCRKCGNKLADDDLFCRKCGAKVVNDSPPTADDAPISDGKPIATPPKSTEKNFLDNSFVQFFLGLLVLTAITVLTYAVVIPPHLSIVDFIKDPQGLFAVVSYNMGAGLFTLTLFLPLLSGLSKLEKISKKYKLKAYFCCTVLNEVGAVCFGTEFFQKNILVYVCLCALVVGIAVRGFASLKRK